MAYTAGAVLRQLREACDLTQAQVALKIEADQAKVSRLEAGAVQAKPEDVRKLLDLYGVTCPRQRSYVLSLLAKDHRPGWWHHCDPQLPLWLQTYLALEAGAVWIRTYDLHVVPGLLQTEEYARAAVEAGHHPVLAGRADLWLDIVRRRQETLLRRGGPAVWAVVEEAALLRPISDDPQVHQAQLDALVAIATDRERHVTMQIIPMTTVPGPLARTGSSTMLRFAQPGQPDVAYMHQLLESVPYDDDEMAYRMAHDIVGVTARPPHDTANLLGEIRNRARYSAWTPRPRLVPKARSVRGITPR